MRAKKSDRIEAWSSVCVQPLHAPANAWPYTDVKASPTRRSMIYAKIHGEMPGRKRSRKPIIRCYVQVTNLPINRRFAFEFFSSYILYSNIIFPFFLFHLKFVFTRCLFLSFSLMILYLKGFCCFFFYKKTTLLPNEQCEQSVTRVNSTY